MATLLRAIHTRLAGKKSPAAGESIGLAQLTLPSNIPPSSASRLAEAIFGLDISETQKWPGYGAYVCYIEDRFNKVGSKWIQPAFSRCTTDESAMDCRGCIDLIAYVSHSIKSSSADNLSIDDVVKRCSLFQIGTALVSNEEPDSGEGCNNSRRALFCILALTTLLYDVPTAPSSSYFDVVFPDQASNIPASQHVENASRPMCGLIRAFCATMLPQSTSPTHDNTDDSDLLHCSTLSYSMLYEFGKITIEWTGLISYHLNFNIATRTLYLFVLPTYCALGCIRTDQDCVFDRIMSNYFDEPGVAHSGSSNVWVQYRQEILLSYRILFGHDRKSRKIFRKLKQQAKRKRSPFTDPLLELLCTEAPSSSNIDFLPGHMWPKSCRTLDDTLQEQDEYSISADLPLLGPRLLAIQTFNLRQRPRNFRGFWKDTRDKPKWYTFWVVSIIGGFALLLAVVQIGLSVAQLVVSVPQG